MELLTVDSSKDNSESDSLLWCSEDPCVCVSRVMTLGIST